MNGCFRCLQEKRALVKSTQVLDEEKRIRGEIYLKRDKVIKVLFKLSVFF